MSSLEIHISFYFSSQADLQSIYDFMGRQQEHIRKMMNKMRTCIPTLCYPLTHTLGLCLLLHKLTLILASICPFGAT